MRAWINLIDEREATGTLKKIYDKVRSPHGTIDNVMRAHSLRPHTMEGHFILYRSVLHNPDNTLPFWFLEIVASYTSILNHCGYSLAHHFSNARRLIGDEAKSDRILDALESRRPSDVFEGKDLALLHYTEKLTVDVGSFVEADIERLRQAGCDDGEILEVNQVCAYFNYSNRLLNGLGVTTEGDTVGYYR